MLRILFILLLGFGSVFAATGERPNVLIVLVDDAGYGDFGCHGHPFLKTPTIDRLHAESARLTDFHVAPMCSPTRGQLLTGVHGLRNGVTSVTAGRTLLRPEFPTAAEMFAASGYRTALFGKWHLGDNYPHRPMDKGFQTALWTRGWGFTSAPEFSNQLTDGRIFRGAKPGDFRGYITDYCFDEAMRWMRESQGSGQPFFCYLPLHAAHAPHQVPDRYRELYADHPASPFFGMLANIDENMGRLDAFLHEAKLRENTIVVFLTDNGGTAGVRIFNGGLRAGKVTYYDGGHRVPCFIRWPAGGLRTAADVGDLTHVQDLLPTLLDFTGAKRLPGPEFDGISLADRLRGKVAALPDRTLLVQFGPGFGYADNTGPKYGECAVIRGPWRLVNLTELYDVEKDRAQEHNIIEQQPEIARQLREAYDLRWKEVSGRLQEFVPISIGSPHENPVELSSADWAGTYVDNSNHIRAASGGPRGGPWHVKIESAGEYEVTLSRWPPDLDIPLQATLGEKSKALPISGARLVVGGKSWSAPARPGASSVKVQATFEAGVTTLQAWFIDDAERDLSGAFYASVRKLP